MKRTLGFCCFLLLTAGWSLAQSNEVSLSAGATWTSDQNLTTTSLAPCPVTDPTCNVLSASVKAKTAFTFEGVYARRLAGAGPVSLFVELPVMGTPGHDVNSIVSSSLAGSQTVPLSSTLLFFTPSAKVKLFSTAKISPGPRPAGDWRISA